jgi:hypothetical protein
LRFHVRSPPSLRDDTIANYTAKRFLPLALRRLNTLRPFLDAMRTIKPWDLFLLRFDLLVNVFFMFKPLKVIRQCVNHSHIFLSRLKVESGWSKVDLTPGKWYKTGKFKKIPGWWI